MIHDPRNGELTHRPAGNEVAPLRTNLEDPIELTVVAQVDVLDHPNREDDLVSAGARQGTSCYSRTTNIGKARRSRRDNGEAGRDELLQLRWLFRPALRISPECRTISSTPGSRRALVGAIIRCVRHAPSL